MLSRIHEKLGTAGFVIGIVALIAALGGTALAAVGLSGKQKNEVTKIAKKYAGKDGAPGATGPQGAKGDPGAKGDAGAEGKQGEKGEPGKNGSDGEDGFCSISEPKCVLPPGATLTGNWSLRVPKGGAEINGAEFLVTVSFPLRVEGGQEPQFVWIGDEDWLEGDEEYDREACPGSDKEPEAAPGFLCFYTQNEGVSINAGVGNRRQPCALPATWTGDLHSGATLAFCVNDVSFNAFAAGSWAVTSIE